MRGNIYAKAMAGLALGLVASVNICLAEGLTKPKPQITTTRHASLRVAANGVDLKSLLAQRARNDYNEEKGIHFTKIQRGNTHIKDIALTFDDGPHQVYTRKLLDVLNNLHVHATFFLVGKQVVKYPQLIQLEVLDGDEVGNHTYDHVNLTKIPSSRVGYELDACDLAIERAIGAPVTFLRPPGGDFNPAVINEVARRYYVTALWTCDPGDYAKPGSDFLLQRSIDKLQNGSIVLLHDGMPETMAILPALVTEARRRGFRFVTMSELVHAK
jgi:peptidoglycan/xylan/chitin deacetylase (PgdA/CDA1 family)